MSDRPNILLVDDRRENLVALEAVLAPLDCRMVSVTSGEEALRQRQHGKVREAIDDANDVLTQPFAGVVDSGSIWAKRGVTTLLALLAYGVIARILIGYLPGRR
jgi:PleD family two-component response regulator